MIALRDLKLTDLEPVVHLFKYRMKVSPRHLLFCVDDDMMLRRSVVGRSSDSIPKRQWPRLSPLQVICFGLLRKCVGKSQKLLVGVTI